MLKFQLGFSDKASDWLPAVLPDNQNHDSNKDYLVSMREMMIIDPEWLDTTFEKQLLYISVYEMNR